MSTLSKAFKSIKNLATAMNEDNSKETNSLSSGIFVDVLNDSIDIKAIKECYIDKLAFIYMPTYVENKADSKFKSEVIKNDEYKPFGAIIDNNIKDYSLLFKSNEKSISLVNTNGKKFLTSPTGFPCEITRLNGEVEKNTIFGLEYLDGKNHRNDILVKYVDSLIIKADRDYYYFGDGINFNNIEEEYNEVIKLMDEANNKLHHSVQQNSDSSIEDKLAKLKKLYDSSLIPEDEYKKKVEELLKQI